MSMISIIAAVACGGVIGQDGKIPWHLPNDLKRFKKLTTGHAVIMGRKTFESILESTGEILPERLNIVITRKPSYRVPLNAEVVNTLPEAFAEAEKWEEKAASKNQEHQKEIFVIGGAEIYELALPYARRFYFTEVNALIASCNGKKVYFPHWDKVENDLRIPLGWRDIVPPEYQPIDKKHHVGFTFRVLERKNLAVDLANAHHPEQREAMERIALRGHCPFCLENLAIEHKKPILHTGDFWVVTENQYPYSNTKLHLLFILKRHAETLEELTPEEGAEYFDILRRLREILEASGIPGDVPGGGTCVRFGKTDFSGGTVAHLHAQLVIPDLDAEGYAPTFFKIGKRSMPA